MARISIAHQGSVSDYVFETDAEAQDVYDRVKKQFDSYERFKRNAGETIEFAIGAYGIATHRLETMSSIALTLGDEPPTWLIERSAKAMVAEQKARLLAREILQPNQ